MILRFYQLINVISILIVLAAATNTRVNAFSNNVTDRQALLSVKSSIALGALSSWNQSIHFCLWKGVTCGRRHQRVTELDLSFQQLQGTLSPDIGNLTFLRAIYLDTNSFHGSIPNEIGQLFRLRYLQLGNNSFQGAFPANLSGCHNIREMVIFNNNLGGKLPTDFSSWSKLKYLNLGKNHFTGSIPPSLGNLSSLRALVLRSNNLAESIPLEVAHLLKLEYLDLEMNNLSGIVPLPLYNISSISKISLTQNQLEGRIPPDLGVTLPNLQNFYIAINKFWGPFPTSITTNASNLVALDISSNNISGPIPMNLGSLSSLEVLNLGDNQFGNSGDLGFLDSLANCTRLNELGLFQNGFRGELPNSIGNLSTTLQRLGVFQNYIHGSIPQEIGKLVNIAELALDTNFLTGRIPGSIGQLSKLGQLYIGDNKISGEIPASISNITGLLILGLGFNMLQGSIPTALFNISSLQGLSLSNNQLSGVIPEEIIGLSSLSVGLYLSQNQLTGSLPLNIGSLKQLVGLDVSDNKFTGKIPATLGDCLMLENLRMEGNLFEGSIPSSFKKLKSLVNLDLSNNILSGRIPSFLGNFHLIEFLNLSHNKLEGEVPKEEKFSNISAFSVVGNSQLCGGIPVLQLPACPKNSSTKKKQIHLRIILILVLLPLAILLACFALTLYRIKKSKQNNNTVVVLQDEQYPRLSYQDLLLATNEFSTNNLLGKGRYGSVYKGILESLQQAVAVKVLNVEVRGANKSFLAECETLRNIRHRNLIKIITACSSTDYKGNDFRALVFEFMTNGSLDNWLHPTPSDQGTERNLTILQRINIAIDVALAVDYLHHRSHTRIIHCDIKPSNILLDEEFAAHVGDFGLAKNFSTTPSDINQVQESSTGVRGTVGYVPPEYGMGGERSAEGDVYSYGILLLEMFSGKRPTASSILTDNANSLHDYVRNALPDRVMEIVDPRIILEGEGIGLSNNESYIRGNISNTLGCLASIFEVGIICSVETPRERINISVALKQLQMAKDRLLSRGQ